VTSPARFDSRIDLEAAVRLASTASPRAPLTGAIDLASHVKRTHRGVEDPHFIPRHEAIEPRGASRRCVAAAWSVMAVAIVAAAVIMSPAAMAQAPSAPTAGGGDAKAPTLEEIRARHEVPGLVVALVMADGDLDIAACGVRARGAEEALRTGDRVHLGSCTKAMTATLAAILVRDGALRWDSTVAEVLGPKVKAIDPSWRETTLEELLRHAGGAPANADPGDWSKAWACQESSRACRRAFVESMLSRPISQPRGTTVYSNQGYAIAGAMIEQTLDDDFETIITRRLFEPLGITSAGFGAPPEARGHAPGGAANTIDNPAAITPAGRVHMSMADWSRFIALHLRRDGGEALPLRREDFDLLHSLVPTVAAPPPADGAAPANAPAPAADRAAPTSDAAPARDAAPKSSRREGMALGWGVTQRPWGGRVLTHAGSNTQWFCVAWLSPERGFAVMSACNQGGPAATKACDEAVAMMIRRHLSEAAPPPER